MAKLSWARLWQHRDRDVVLSILGVRLAVVGLGLMAYPLLGGPAWTAGVGDFWTTAFHQWDGPWYVSIAENGYQVTGDEANLIVFLPLYPFLIKTLSFVTRSYVGAALLISNVAAVAHYQLARPALPSNLSPTVTYLALSRSIS